MQQNAPEPGPIDRAKRAFNLLILACQVFAAPVELVLRRGFGSRYVALPHFLAFLLLPMWMVFWPYDDPLPVLAFWVLYVVMLARARVESFAAFRRGEAGHTRYNGWPRLKRWFPRLDEVQVKRAVEPFVTFAAGVRLSGPAGPCSQALTNMPTNEPDNPGAGAGAVPALRPALPAWVTPALVELTLRIWRPFYKNEHLSEADAVNILLTVGRLFAVLRRE